MQTLLPTLELPKTAPRRAAAAQPYTGGPCRWTSCIHAAPARTRGRGFASAFLPAASVAAAGVRSPACVAHKARGRARPARAASRGFAGSPASCRPRSPLRLPPARHSGVVQRRRAWPPGKRDKPDPSQHPPPRVGATPRVQGQRTTAVKRRRPAAIPSGGDGRAGYARLGGSPSQYAPGLRPAIGFKNRSGGNRLVKAPCLDRRPPPAGNARACHLHPLDKRGV